MNLLCRHRAHLAGASMGPRSLVRMGRGPGLIGTAMVFMWRRWWWLPAKRPVRFSLRRMLVAIALFTLWIGTAGIELGSFSRENQAVWAIRRAGRAVEGHQDYEGQTAVVTAPQAALSTHRSRPPLGRPLCLHDNRSSTKIASHRSIRRRRCDTSTAQLATFGGRIPACSLKGDRERLPRTV